MIHCSGNALFSILREKNETEHNCKLGLNIKVNHDDVLCGEFENCFDYCDEFQMLYNFDVREIDKGKLKKLVDCSKCIAIMKKHGV